LTDYFGIDTEQGYDGDSKGTQYVQLDAAIPFNDQWSVALHAAHRHIGETRRPADERREQSEL
jgi:hypothetical protein